MTSARRGGGGVGEGGRNVKIDTRERKTAARFSHARARAGEPHEENV